VALLPPLVVTVTSTGPGAAAGASAAIDELECTVKDDAAVAPNRMEVAPVKFVPVMVTLVPPVAGPELGLRAVTTGGGGTKVNLSADEVALVPNGVATVTSTAPAFSGGDVAEMDLADITANDDAGVVPNLTAVAPAKFVPVMVTVVPPVIEPEVGWRRVTVGGGGGVTKVNLSAFLVALVPPGPVTMTSTFPDASAGEVAVIELSVVTTKERAGTVPK